jgi:membrane associated rhomboid family serine protease
LSNSRGIAGPLDRVGIRGQLPHLGDGASWSARVPPSGLFRVVDQMTPWVRRLLIANVAVFVAAAPPFGLLGLIPQRTIYDLMFVPADILQRPWTVITYQFLHAGIAHLLFNMIGVFFFGPRLEVRLGSRAFLGLYLASGVGGALLSIFTPNAAILGASGAVFGILLGFARYWPHERIYIWGILPIPARILVLLLAAMSIWSIGGGLGGGIAHLAHLGGFLGGWVYLILLERNSAARKFRQQVEAVAPLRPGGRDLERWEGVDRAVLHPLNRQEFERLLARAHLLGPGGLSPHERAFMERFTTE